MLFLVAALCIRILVVLLFYLLDAPLLAESTGDLKEADRFSRFVYEVLHSLDIVQSRSFYELHTRAHALAFLLVQERCSTSMGEKPSSEWFTTALIVATLLSCCDYFYVVPITHISKCIVSLLSNCAYFYAASKYTYTYLYLIYMQIYISLYYIVLNSGCLTERGFARWMR